jgi:hypothetical protein
VLINMLREQMKWNVDIVLLGLSLFLCVTCQPLNAQPGPPPRSICRAPGGDEIFLFEPLQFLWGYNDRPEQVSEYGYTTVPIGQETAPNPNPDPNRGLIRFIDLCRSPEDMGILYIYTEGSRDENIPPRVALEFYLSAMARNVAYTNYLNDPDYIDYQFEPDDFLPVEAEGPNHIYYGLGLSLSGVSRHCTNLKEVFVFGDFCYSSQFNFHWNALVSLGWNGKIGGTGDSDAIFRILLGKQEEFRTQYNANREVHNAALSFSRYLFSHGCHLMLNSSRNAPAGSDYDLVVLAPMVLRHSPGQWEQVGASGWVEFDCHLERGIGFVNVANAVHLTGFYRYNQPLPQLSNVQWDDLSDYRITFDLPDDLSDYCWVDFLVNPDEIISDHNHIHLDGNTNPPANYFDGIASGMPPDGSVSSIRTANGFAPNNDFYNWTGKICDNAIISFENDDPNEQNWHHDRDPIGTSISGMEFLPSPNYTWRYGETTENTRVYPFNEAIYWVDGRWGAFHGEGEEEIYVHAQISFAPPVSSVCTGYKLDATAAFIAHGVGGGIQQLQRFVNSNNQLEYPESYSLGQIWMEIPNNQIDILDIYHMQNRCIVDNMMLFGATYDARGMMPNEYEFILDESREIVPGGDSITYVLNVQDIVDSLRIICNWVHEEGRSIRLEIRDPNGALQYEKETEDSPIAVPLIVEPLAGNWKVILYATGAQGKPFHVAAVAGVEYEPLVDCYVTSDDIWWVPDSAQLGQTMHIFTRVHAGDQFNRIVHHVRVGCYLGDPVNEMPVCHDQWAMHIEPGGIDTICYQFESEWCIKISPCEVYIVVDPRNELEEYDENNNIASKKVVFLK